MEHFSASQILGSPLTADPHEAAHVVVRLSSIPHAGQGPSQKMIELKFTLVKGIVMGCGIARFGRRGLKKPKLDNFVVRNHQSCPKLAQAWDKTILSNFSPSEHLSFFFFCLCKQPIVDAFPDCNIF